MNISVLGCGWLGLPLAEHLIRRDHEIKGSTTSENKLSSMRDEGIRPFLLKLTPELEENESLDEFWQSDVLVLNIPPGRGRKNIRDYHSRQIKSVINAIADSDIAFVIFASSTSVYPAYPGFVSEMDAVTGKAGRNSGNALLEAESLLTGNKAFNTTVLRFGGLYGGDRHPAKYMAGQKDLEKADAPVNLIHRDDCITIITQIIEEQITGEIFNAVADGHPSRQEYYTEAAKKLGLEPPEFNANSKVKNYKVVSNEKLKSVLSYSFIHPHPGLP